MNIPDYEELLSRTKVDFKDVPHCLLETIVKDYTLRPEYYEEIYSENIKFGSPKKRDTQDDLINNIAIDNNNKNECTFN